MLADGCAFPLDAGFTGELGRLGVMGGVGILGWEGWDFLGRSGEGVEEGFQAGVGGEAELLADAVAGGVDCVGLH